VIVFANDQRRTTNDQKDYNNAVNSPVRPPPTADGNHPDDRHSGDQHSHRHAAYAAEATGLLMMAVVLLLLIIIRYWRYIPWGAR
jgi:hypothetical protein